MAHGPHVQCPDCIIFHGRFICENLDRSITESKTVDPDFDSEYDDIIVSFSHMREQEYVRYL